MRIRLGEALKFVAILGVGLGLARGVIAHQHRGILSGGIPGTRFAVHVRLWTYHVLNPILVGVGLAGGTAVWIEAARRHPRPRWGTGRWTFSAIAAIVAVQYVYMIAVGYFGSGHFPGSYRHWKDPAASSSYLFHNVADSRVMTVVLACWASAKLAGGTGDREPDLLEWAGRFLLLSLVFTSIGLDVIGAALR